MVHPDHLQCPAHVGQAKDLLGHGEGGQLDDEADLLPALHEPEVPLRSRTSAMTSSSSMSAHSIFTMTASSESCDISYVKILVKRMVYYLQTLQLGGTLLLGVRVGLGGLLLGLGEGLHKVHGLYGPDIVGLVHLVSENGSD